ncbi:uncharacterized protein LOC128675004 [Plodia interpunctella]|uniref:uncharacterized protein LOC128675004 n=1 Tax=Plodia interpunctella TaxID=58824 RepID=UPI002368273A|nr:uncharacterized protein LOC128675004 [Plodia interpunctella]
MMSSGGRVGRSALVMLLVSLGAAVEVFDAAADPTAAQDNNIDSDLFRESDALMQNVFTFDQIVNRLLEGFAREQDNMMPHYKSNRIDFQVASNFPIEYKEVMKRLPSALRSQPVRPQQKWKIKKGKALGTQMVCYFKLCAFRSPH